MGKRIVITEAKIEQARALFEEKKGSISIRVQQILFSDEKINAYAYKNLITTYYKPQADVNIEA